MTPTARLDNLKIGARRDTSGLGAGLGQETYELWHYHDTKEAVGRILGETPVTIADKYVFTVPDYTDAIAEKTVSVVRGEGGSARLETRTQGLNEYKVAVVESETPRATVDNFVEQVISDAKLGDYDGPNDAAMEIIFEEIASSKSPPDTEVISVNEFNPLPFYSYLKNYPCIEWEQVREGGGNGNGESDQAFPVQSASNTGGGEGRVVAQTGGSDALLGRMGQTITLGVVRNNQPQGAAFFSVPDRLSATKPGGQGQTILFTASPIPAPLIQAANAGNLVAMPKKAEGAVPPSEVPTNGSGNGGNGSGENGSTGNGANGGGRVPPPQQGAGIVPGVSNATLILGTAGLLSVTIVAASQ